MSGKPPSSENSDVSHHEKNTYEATEPTYANVSGRRKSVALNIVENPLKVRLPASRKR